MVRVTGQHAALSREYASTEDWLTALGADYPENEVAFIRSACVFAEAAHQSQQRATGEPYFRHLLSVAGILADLHLDYETIAAALLHDVVEDTGVKPQELAQRFGAQVGRLVEGVTKMAVLPEYRGVPARQEHAQAESLRKMLLAMAEDVRVVLIKLADRLHNMRTLAALPEDKQLRIARETMDIFAPLANRLGIWQIKWELEDLAFRYLEPLAYRQVAQLLAERRVDREQYIAEFVAELRRELAAAGVRAEVYGRPKHLYGIWRKMQRKHKDFGQIFDVRAVRVLADSVKDCYGVLGVVHTRWQYIPGEFDDYIATPKENNYRSIHTAIIGPGGKTVEVQIRTQDMHQQSEYGVAAHWRYKEGRPVDGGFDEKINWLRSLLEWKDEVAEASDFVDQFKSEVFSERVYVFTPKGSIVDLAHGATPLDFAYHIHTDVGHRCRGAKVNGQMVPLTYVLRTGEQVEIITTKQGGPSRDWLSPHLGYLGTSRARAKVQAWFRQQNFESNVAAGREVLARELQRLGLAEVRHERLAERFHFGQVEEFFAAVGRGEVRPAQILHALQEFAEPAPPVVPSAAPARAAHARAAPSGVTILGVGNLLTRMARCCNPVPGEAVVGFITRGQGITIHRQDCANALRHRDEHDERLIEVSWGTESGKTYPVDIEILAHERAGLLRDITSLLADEKVNVLAVNTLTDQKEYRARMVFTIEVADLSALARVLALIDRIPNILEVHRRTR